MARTLREQLLDAWEASGLTLGQLLTLSGLDMDETSLSRKLRGSERQSLRTDEAEALATALRVRISAGREARAS